MQVERGAPALVVLRGDQAPVEALIFARATLERLRQRIEPVGDGGKLRAAAAAASRTW